MAIDRRAVARWVLDHLVWFILATVLLVLSFTVEGFMQWGIYRNILVHAVFVGILAIGEALVIISKEMDLSIESVAGLAAIVTAWLTGTGLDASGLMINGYATLAIVLCMGLLIGFFNGFMTVKARISSFIVTLAGYLMFRAIGLVVTNGHGVIRLLPEVTAVAKLKIGGFPIIILVMVFVYIVFYLFLTRTRFGHHIYLVGDNKQAVFNAGIRVDRLLIGVFALSGMLAAFTGWLLAARTNGAAPNIGMGMLFEAMAAVVIGGVSLKGGTGNLMGVLAGAILLSAISTAISIVGIPAFYMNVIRGGFILVAVLLDAGVQRVRPYLM